MSSEKDSELEDLIKSLFPDAEEATMTTPNDSAQEKMETLRRRLQSFRAMAAALPPSMRDNPELESIINETNDLMSQANTLFDIPDPNRSKLSDEKRAEIKRLVDAGASLSNIDALHLAASHYKQRDLFDLLIDEYGLGIEDPDHDSLLSKPLHVAGCLGNCEAIDILLAKGADKKSRNSKGRTPLQEVKHSNREMQRGGMPDFLYQQLRLETNVDRVTIMLS